MLRFNTKVNDMAKTNNAKTKAPTKAERLRTNLIKANASAAKKLPGSSFDSLAIALVDGTKRADGAGRTMAHFMNGEFAEQMKAFRCHWSAFTTANCRTDNEKAILARVEGYKKQVRDLAETKGLANINKPWSDMRKIAIELFSGGQPKERAPQALDKRQCDVLTKLYKACMKEERPTDTELAINDMIGRALAHYFKVDLSKLG